MTKLPVQIHISDTGFSSRCTFEEAYILPSTTATEDSDAIPHATVASCWMLGATDATGSGFLEHIPLGWRCPLCGVVEVEKLYWRGYFKTDTETKKIAAAEKAAAAGSKSNRRRLQKEKLRERRLAVKPFCDNCYVCPRCQSGSGSLGGLQIRLTKATTTNGLQYHVSCAYCQWHSFSSFPTMEMLLGYLAVTDAFASREDTLRSWRRAQREANDLLREHYAPSYETEKTATDRGVSPCFSHAAWEKYIELLRPPQKIAGKHGQDPSLNISPSREVSFATPAAAKRGGDDGMSPLAAPPEIPRLNLNLSSQSSTSQRSETHAKPDLCEEETRIFNEIKQRGSMYTSVEGLHPAVALERLRELFEKQRLYEGKLPNAPASMRLPTFVHRIQVGDLLRDSAIPLANAPWEYESNADEGSGGHGASTGDCKHGERADDPVSAFHDDEAAMVGCKQAEQWGLHPLYAGSAPDVAELRRAMVPINAMMNSAIGGGYSAATRTGLKSEKMVVGDASNSASPQQFASPRPVTARNVAADGPESVVLEKLLTSPTFEPLLQRLLSYYIQHPRKTCISALVRRLPADVSNDHTDGRLSHRFLLLDCDGDDNHDIKPLLDYWKDQSAPIGNADGEVEPPTATLVTYRDDGLEQRLDLVCGSTYSASRNVPCFQLMKVSGIDAESPGGRAYSSQQLVFRVVNWSTQTIVVRSLRVAKRRLLGGKISSLSLTAANIEVSLPQQEQPFTWVKLLPLCTPAEAAVAGFIDRGAAVLPPTVAVASSECAAVKELLLTLSVEIPTKIASEPQEKLFVGLEINILTALPSLLQKSSAVPGQCSSSNIVLREYHDTSVGVSIVW